MISVLWEQSSLFQSVKARFVTISCTRFTQPYIYGKLCIAYIWSLAVPVLAVVGSQHNHTVVSHSAVFVRCNASIRPSSREIFSTFALVVVGPTHVPTYMCTHISVQVPPHTQACRPWRWWDWSYRVSTCSAHYTARRKCKWFQFEFSPSKPPGVDISNLWIYDILGEDGHCFTCVRGLTPSDHFLVVCLSPRAYVCPSANPSVSR